MTDVEERVRRALQDHALDGSLAPPPGTWERIVARGQVSSRRRAVRTGASVLLAAAAVVAAVIVVRTAGDTDGQVDVDTQQPSHQPLLPRCNPWYGGDPPTDDLAPDQVSDLRYLPTWLPDGDTVMETRAERRFYCMNAEDFEPVLVLRQLVSWGGGDIVEAVVNVHGPFTLTTPTSQEPFDDTGHTELRGVQATIEQTHDGRSTVTWTEPDGATWVMSRSGGDDQQMTALAESLRLDSDPSEGTPFASLPATSLPSGFEEAWQASSLPEPVKADPRTWVVTTDRCELTFQESSSSGSVWETSSKEGDALVMEGEVHFGLFRPSDSVLIWDVAPGVVGSLGCQLDSESIDVPTAIDIAASVSLESAPGITSGAVG